MTNEETAAYLREYVKTKHGLFSWPTDACGYDQHIKFVTHRNENWTEERAKTQTFEEFILEYAAALEKESG